MTEPTYPYADGDVTVLGPEIFASPDGDVISWKGDNYVRQAPAADQAVLLALGADAIRAAACPGNCGAEEECARTRIQPVVWHHGRLAVVEGTPEQFADAVLAVLPAIADRAALTARIAAKKAEPAFREFAASQERAAEALVADTRRAVHEALILLPAPEADRVRSLIADLETAVEGRTAMRAAAESAPADTGHDDSDGEAAALAPPAADRCSVCGHTVCDGDGPCGALSGDDFCTCPGPAAAQQPKESAPAVPQCDGCGHLVHRARKCPALQYGERCECDEPLATDGEARS